MKLTIRRHNKTEGERAKASAGGARQRRRGQSLVELALLLPLLVMILSVVIEGGLAFNAWIRVNTAARDAARFAMDQGTQADTQNLVLFKLKGVDFGTSRDVPGSTNIDIFRIEGATDGNGDIPNNSTYWKKDQIYNGNGSNSDQPRITRTAIKTRLNAGPASAANIEFVIVEVDFQYTPLLGSLIAPGSKIPMTSYAIIQQEPNN